MGSIFIVDATYQFNRINSRILKMLSKPPYAGFPDVKRKT
jgi:hypothetical protein